MKTIVLKPSRILYASIIIGLFVLTSSAVQAQCRTNCKPKQYAYAEHHMKYKHHPVKRVMEKHETVWVEGHWVWDYKIQRNIWIDGRWVQQKVQQIWIEGRWIKGYGGLVWQPAHWERI